MDGVNSGAGGLTSTTSLPVGTPNHSNVHYPTTPITSNMMTTAHTMSPVAASNAPQAMASPVKSNVQCAVAAPAATSSPMSISQGTPSHRPSQPASSDPSKVLDRRRVQQLVKEVDPLEQLDDEVEEMLMQIADDFIDNVVSASCQLAKHRKGNTVEVKDVQLHLERSWNMVIPGFGSEDLKPYRKSATTEAHKQRLALIKKTLKKY